MATSDHQCEAFDPRWPDDADVWEQATSQLRAGVIPRGTATEFWTRYSGDVDRAASLGCKLFRFSISWARVEEAVDQWNEENLQHYVQLVDYICSRGMEPVVTLLHGVWPTHVERDHSLLGRKFPERFGLYAARVASAMGERVKYWITINEGSMLPFCYVKPPRAPRFPRAPGLVGAIDLARELNAVGLVLRNLFIANMCAYEAIKAVSRESMVSANPYILGLPDNWFDALAEAADDQLGMRAGAGIARGSAFFKWLARLFFPRQRGVWDLADAAPAAFNGTVWHLGIAGRLDPELCPSECRYKQDFVAFDYYWGISHMIRDLPRVGPLLTGAYDRAPLNAEALRHLLKYLSGLFPEQSIWLAENGCVPMAAGGKTRNQYLTEHLDEVRRAQEEGVNVAAYILWSITTNREWGLRPTPAVDFGLYNIDLDLGPDDPHYQERKPTDSVELYQRVIADWSRSS